MPYVMEVGNYYIYGGYESKGFHSNSGLKKDIEDASLLDRDEVLELSNNQYPGNIVRIYLVIDDMIGGVIRRPV